MEILINELLKLGARRPQFTAQLYGGASVIKNRSNIGKSNVEFAEAFLRDEGIRCIGKDVGGTLARRIKMHAVTGRVKHILVEDPGSTLVKAERAVAPKSTPAEVTLF